MSLCIAATCRFENDQPCIVHCSDMAGTRGDVKSDDIIKIRNVGDNTVLLAGNMGHARLLLSVCEPHIKGHLNGGDDLSITKLYQGLIKAVAARKRDVATAVLSAEMGFGWDEVFNFSQAHQNDPLWIDSWHKIRSLGLGAEMIVSTFTDDEAAILVIEQNGNVAWPDHYAAIGSGASVAQAFLHQRDYVDIMSVEECLYRVLEAKTAAEKNPHVGRTTLLEFRIPDISYYPDDAYIEEIAQSIREARLKVPSHPIDATKLTIIPLHPPLKAAASSDKEGVE